ncbi:MAG: hypothetical protein GY880_29540 [Planctomycetaceae bacterium]|nr:hypothetical protein [Planctomycetaceae bacterium]
MDSKPITFETVIRFSQQRRIRALFVGVIMLAVLAAVQVQQHTSESRLCELYPNAKLSEGELYRLEVALIQEGLEEFKTNTEGKLLVPTSKRLEYIKAIARQNEEPVDYRKAEDSGDTPPSIFLPKSARDAMTLEAKKKKIEKNILRLPYIIEASFEMDQPSGYTTFQKQQTRASISLATKDNLPLTEERVKTIKAIIQVAAGVELKEIVMIDLKTGLIHDEPHSPINSNLNNIATDIAETRRDCEARINEALAMYPEIKATVAIAVEQAPSIPSQQQQALAAKPQGLKSRSPSILQAGANNAVKLETSAYSKPAVKVQELSSQTTITKVVSICVDVPEKLVSERTPTSQSFLAQSDLKSRDLNQDAFNAQFQKLKSEISKKVELTLLSTPDLKCDDTIAFNLIPATTTTAEPIEMRLKKIAAENWPSGIVLLVGLILLVSISRGSDPLPNNSNLQISGSSLHPGMPSVNDTESPSDSETRLTQLIEKDPDAAARVIESWIRDAA